MQKFPQTFHRIPNQYQLSVEGKAMNVLSWDIEICNKVFPFQHLSIITMKQANNIEQQKRKFS
jgi:hypothetical protein